MGLPVRLRISYPLFNYVRSLFDKLSVEINRIPVYSAHCIVLPKDVIRGLLIVLVHHLPMPFTLFRELVGGCSISALIGFARLAE